jgi:surface carbohydrate biosynthesis protein
MNPVVYLTCELKSRDFDSRLLIASHLLRLGFAVVVGQQWSMFSNAKVCPTGCYLVKTVNKIMAGYIAKARDPGHVIVAMDEESLPLSGDLFLSNIDSSAIAMTDLFLAMHDAQSDILRRHYPALRLATTGSARVDLMTSATYDRPLPQPYILFNTSFALVNSLRSSVDEAVQILIQGGLDPNTAEGRHEIDMRLGFERRVQEDMTALIKWCADTLPFTSVVRPHPAENPATWIKSMPANVRVVAGDNPLPWISGAELVVHANSTTGLEAAVLGRPCINFSPTEFKGWTDQFVMARINPTARVLADVKDMIEGFLQKRNALTSASTATWFQARGAENTAAAIANLMRERGAGPKLKGAFKWQKFTRNDVQQAKFTASKDEFASGMRRLAPGLAFQCTELDDSIVLMAAG